MATLPIDRPVSPLRQRMLDDMTMRAMRSRTQHDYVRHVRAFAAFLDRSPDTATAEDVRRFQLPQREHGAGESVIGATVSALRFLFGVTLKAAGADPSCLNVNGGANRARPRAGRS